MPPVLTSALLLLVMVGVLLLSGVRVVRWWKFRDVRKELKTRRDSQRRG